MVELREALGEVHESEAFEDLLGSFARDERGSPEHGVRGTLLRSMRERARRPRARSWAPSSLEHHLRGSDREQVAHCLREAAQRRMEQSLVGQAMNSWTRVDRPSTPPIEDPAAEGLAHGFPDWLAESVLARGGFAELAQGASAAELAGLACRVAPTPSNRFLHGTAVAFTGEALSGLRILMDVVRAPCGDEVRRCALQNASVAAWRLGSLPEAQALIERATSGSAGSPAAWVDRLALAIRSGDSTLVDGAVQGFSEALETNASAYAEGVRSTRLVLRTSEGAPSRDMIGFARSQALRHPGIAGRFLEETFGASGKPKDGR